MNESKNEKYGRLSRLGRGRRSSPRVFPSLRVEEEAEEVAKVFRSIVWKEEEEEGWRKKRGRAQIEST